MPAMRIRVALLLVLIGCTTHDGPVAIDDLGSRVVDAVCQQYVRCGVFTNQSFCAATFRIHEQDIVAAVKDGTVKYDGGKAADCLAAFSADTCDPTTHEARVEPQACKDTFKGTVADGGACEVNEQCVSQSCNLQSCSMACCPGTCAPTPAAPAAIGQPCTGACADGAFCKSGTCAALLAAGTTCQSDSDCDYGLACVGATGAEKCAAAPSAGQACVSHYGSSTPSSCIVEGLTCDTTAMKCVAFLDSGATCSAQGPQCKQDLACDPTTSKCGALPAVGQSCSGSCAVGAFCDFSGTGKCVAVLPDGQACTSDEACQSGNCDTTTTKCTEPATCG